MTREEFKWIRVQRHHSQESLAEVLDYSRRQIVRWENGESAIPDRVAYVMRYEVPNWFKLVRKESR